MVKPTTPAKPAKPATKGSISFGKLTDAIDAQVGEIAARKPPKPFLSTPKLNPTDVASGQEVIGGKPVKDPEQLDTYIKFGRNLAEIRGTKISSDVTSQVPLVNGRHAASAQVRSAYTVAGQEPSKDVFDIMNQLDSLAVSWSQVGQMDTKTRIALAGQGYSMASITDVKSKEQELLAKLSELTLPVISKDAILDRRTKEANTVTALSKAAESVAIAANAMTAQDISIKSAQLALEESERLAESNKDLANDMDTVRSLSMDEMVSMVKTGQYNGANPTTVNKIVSDYLVVKSQLQQTINPSAYGQGKKLSPAQQEEALVTQIANGFGSSGNVEAYLQDPESLELSPEFKDILNSASSAQVKKAAVQLQEVEQKLGSLSPVDKRVYQSAVDDAKVSYNLAVTSLSSTLDTFGIPLNTESAAFEELTTYGKKLEAAYTSGDPAVINSVITNMNSFVSSTKESLLQSIPKGKVRDAYTRAMASGLVTIMPSEDAVTILDSSTEIANVGALGPSEAYQDTWAVLSAFQKIFEGAGEQTTAQAAVGIKPEQTSPLLESFAKNPENADQLQEFFMAGVVQASLEFSILNKIQGALKTEGLTPEQTTVLNSILGDLFTQEGSFTTDPEKLLFINTPVKYIDPDTGKEEDLIDPLTSSAYKVNEMDEQGVVNLAVLLNGYDRQLKEVGLELSMRDSMFKLSDSEVDTLVGQVTPSNMQQAAIVGLAFPNSVGSSSQTIKNTLKGKLYVAQEVVKAVIEANPIIGQTEQISALAGAAEQAGFTETKAYQDANSKYIRNQGVQFNPRAGLSTTAPYVTIDFGLPDNNPIPIDELINSGFLSTKEIATYLQTKSSPDGGN